MNKIKFHCSIFLGKISNLSSPGYRPIIYYVFCEAKVYLNLNVETGMLHNIKGI